MNFILNQQLFTAHTFDSGSLGILASVIHQFSTPGIYTVSIRKDDAIVGETRFEVSEQSAEMQLDIDLAAAPHPLDRHAGCGCKKSASGLPVLSPKGYVLFFASSGIGGYSAVAGLQGERKPAFDSQHLQKGDLFALSLMEPTVYEMSNMLGKAKGEITVTFDKKDAQSLRHLETQMVEVTQDEFKPKALKLIATQGVVFQIQDAARIVIKKSTPAAKRGKREKVRVKM